MKEPKSKQTLPKDPVSELALSQSVSDPKFQNVATLFYSFPYICPNLKFQTAKRRL